MKSYNLESIELYRQAMHRATPERQLEMVKVLLTLMAANR